MAELGVHRETDLLALVRAKKKVRFWLDVVSKVVPEVAGQDANERYAYWLGQVNKYEPRIESHVNEFKAVNDPVSFLFWITGIIDTIKDILKIFKVI